MGAPSTSTNLLITGIGLINLPKSAGFACCLSLGNKLLYKMILNKNNKYKKQSQKEQQSRKSFKKLYTKSLQDNLIHKSEYESLSNIFTKYFDERKNESFS